MPEAQHLAEFHAWNSMTEEQRRKKKADDKFRRWRAKIAKENTKFNPKDFLPALRK